MSDVTPCDSTMPGMSGVRACACTSISPGTTSLPVASMVSFAPSGAMPTPTAAMRPFAIATSAMRSKPRDGSITRPPRISTSCGAAYACLLLANDTAPERRRPHELPSREHLVFLCASLCL